MNMVFSSTGAEDFSRSRALATFRELLDVHIAAGTPARSRSEGTTGRSVPPATERVMGHIELDSASAHKLVVRGISSKVIVPLGEFLGLGKATVAEYLDLDRGTANRRAAKDQLLPTHAAEAVLRLLELDRMAGDTFETQAEASAWLRRPHPMLDGESPLEAARTGYGTQRVRDILLAIRHGGVV
jgi:putative toxin-antitoxin system antitoxin component (TIGR02293 family)